MDADADADDNTYELEQIISHDRLLIGAPLFSQHKNPQMPITTTTTTTTTVNSSPSEEALDKEEVEDENDKEGGEEEEEEEEEGGREEVKKLWDIIRVIPTDEEQVVCCCVHGCIVPAIATWSSNIVPEDKWDYCEDCQLKEMGGWPDGVNKRQKTEIVVEAGEYNFEDNDNDDTEDKVEDATTGTLDTPLKRQQKKQPTRVLTEEQRDRKNKQAREKRKSDQERSDEKGIKKKRRNPRWTQEEHQLFLKHTSEYVRNWKMFATIFTTRTAEQIKNYSEKYYSKNKAAAAERELVDEEKKRKRVTASNNDDEKKIQNKRKNPLHWNQEEHEQFLKHRIEYDRNWKMFETIITTRTARQINMYAERFYSKNKAAAAERKTVVYVRKFDEEKKIKKDEATKKKMREEAEAEAKKREKAKAKKIAAAKKREEAAKKKEEKKKKEYAREHIDEKPLNDILIEATLAIAGGESYASDRFAIRPGNLELGQAASFHFGTVNYSSSKGPTINHTFERGSQALVAMGYEVRGANKGSKFAHSAGIEPQDKNSKAMMTDNVTVQQTLNFAPSPNTHKQTKSCSMVFSLSTQSARVAVEKFDELVPDKDKLKEELQNVVTQSKVWPNLVSLKEDNERSKGYMPIGVSKVVDKLDHVKIGISMNCRPSTMTNLKLTESAMKENTCIFYSPILARIINHKSHHHQLRIHYYPEDGGYMSMHCDNDGENAQHFIKLSYTETGVGYSFE